MDEDDDSRTSAKFSNSALAASTLWLHNEAHLDSAMDRQDLSGCFWALFYTWDLTGILTGLLETSDLYRASTNNQFLP